MRSDEFRAEFVDMGELRTDSKLVTGAADGQDWSNKE